MQVRAVPCPDSWVCEYLALKWVLRHRLPLSQPADAAWSAGSLVTKLCLHSQIPELQNQHLGLLCVGVACYAAVDKLEPVRTLVLLSRPTESTMSCTHAPDYPQIASDLTGVGSCDSTWHVEIPPVVSLPPSLREKA